MISFVSKIAEEYGENVHYPTDKEKSSGEQK